MNIFCWFLCSDRFVGDEPHLIPTPIKDFAAVAVVHLDMREFEKKAQQMGIFARDQLPYAISRSLNDAMFKDVRQHIVNVTWPAAFQVRNRGLARASMRVEPSTKQKWSAGVYDALGKADLARHAEGGEKTHSGTLAIPNRARIKLHARGKKPWARELDRLVPKRALRVIKGKGIFVGEGGELHLMYSFSQNAKLDKRFSFYEDFTAKAPAAVRARFPAHIQRAIKTSFR